VVTHDDELAAQTQRIIHLKGGKIYSDKPTIIGKAQNSE